jgi:HB1, ASXL, restriction endonuclease HTH domain
MSAKKAAGKKSAAGSKDAQVKKSAKPNKPEKVEKELAAESAPVIDGRKAGKLSALEAAVRVLGEEGRAMNCQALIEAMAAKGYWTSPGGKTPASTLYASLSKEITTKGTEARFVKVARGQFALRERS